MQEATEIPSCDPPPLHCVILPKAAEYWKWETDVEWDSGLFITCYSDRILSADAKHDVCYLFANL